MITFYTKVAGLVIVLLAYSTPIAAQELKISDLPQPMDSIQKTPDLTGISVPQKPSVSSEIHLEQIRTVSANLDQQTALRGAGSDLFRRLVNGVVFIYAGEGFGSGAIIDPLGLVITNWHVIAGHQTVGVMLRNKGTGVKKIRNFTGQVIRTNKKQDLALLKIDIAHIARSDITVLPLGHMSEVEIGMEVHAIGHPKGKNWSYTRGAVSQIRERFTWRYDEHLRHEANVIQSQTPINPGNSGGPLFSNGGNIVGINSFGDPNAEGINFAVSVDNIRSLIKGEDAPPTRNSILPEPLSRYAKSRWDRDGNGIPDSFGFDTDRNGKIDLYAEDADEDDKAEIWFLDLNENGIKDGFIVNASKYYDDIPGQVWIFDANEDEEPELMGFDYNSDGQIDEYSVPN